MLVHVLLYDAGQDSEGIHSLELSGSTVVLMFENPDDAERYAGLLEAQDFPVPSIEALDREEIESRKRMLPDWLRRGASRNRERRWRLPLDVPA